MNILTNLQKIDRRAIYILLVVVIMIPLIARPAKHPKMVVPEVQSAYDVIQHAPKDKMVIISSVWGPGTEAENAPQTAAIMRHLFRNGIRFGIVSWDQAGSQMTYQIGKTLEKEMHKTYGVDWVHFGYKLWDKSAILGMAENLPGVLPTDKNRKKVADMPVMKGIKNYKDFGAVVEITPSGTLELMMAYMTQPHGIPLIYCPTAVMSVEAYKYIDSGQIKGMLNGVVGAAQYESLLGMDDVPTDASATTWALSAAHISIIVLIVLGNLGYLAAKRATRVQGGNS